MNEEQDVTDLPFRISKLTMGLRQHPASGGIQGSGVIEVIESFLALCRECKWSGRVYESQTMRPGTFFGNISHPSIRVYCGANASHNGAIPIEVFFRLRDSPS